MKKILFVLGESKYGVTRFNQSELRDAFVSLGHRTKIVDMMRVDHGPVILQQILNAIERFQPDFIFTYGQLLDLEVGGQAFTSVINRPHIAMIADHPSKHMDRIKAFTPLHGLFFLDESHAHFTRGMLDNPSYGLIDVMPAGVNLGSRKAPRETSVEAFEANRDIDILFTGSLYEFEPSPWANMPPIFRMIMDRALELAREHRVSVAHEMVIKASQEVLGPHGTELPREAIWAAGHVSEILNAERRWNMVQMMAKAGLPVTIVGEGWARRKFKLKSFRFLERVGADEIPALNARARVVINANRNYDAGAHDRLFAALGSGAAVVSDYSHWIARNFTPGQEVLLANPQAPGEMVKQVRALIDTPELAWKMGRAGQKAALAGHSWRDRAATIIRAADMLTQQAREAATA